jgi:hypothetical protein
VGVAYYDALTSGNLLAYVSVNNRVLQLGKPYQLPVGNLVIAF